MTPGNFADFIPLLAKHDVRYILIGGGAAIAHGAARTTYDVDILYSRTAQNLQHVVDALSGLHPYLRGAPEGLPFSFDVQLLENGLNFTLTTTAGDIDLLGEVVGGGSYEDLLANCDTYNLYGHEVSIVNLETLIRLKRAAGRPKDFESIGELENLLRLRKQQEG